MAERGARVEAAVVIVGAGVSGLATALRLGRKGHGVALVDKAPLPRDKVCGEGIMPWGVAALRELGLTPEALPGIDFAGLAFRAGRHEALLEFAPGSAGRGMRRTVLIGALQTAVEKLPGVVLHRDSIRGPVWAEGRIVGVRGMQAEYRGSVVVAADGAHSALARSAGVPLRVAAGIYAVRQHFRLAPHVYRSHPAGRVRVGLFPPYDLYLTPTGEDELLATTMTDREGYRALAGHDYGAFLARSPYGELFVAAEPVSPLLRWYHPRFQPAAYSVGGMLLAGDAGGTVDPCIGLGISSALHTAAYAAEAAHATLQHPGAHSAHARRFQRRRERLFQNVRTFDKFFGLLVHSHRGSRVLAWSMMQWPGVAASVLRRLGTGRSLRPGPVAWQAVQAGWRRVRQLSGSVRL